MCSKRSLPKELAKHGIYQKQYDHMCLLALSEFYIDYLKTTFSAHLAAQNVNVHRCSKSSWKKHLYLYFFEKRKTCRIKTYSICAAWSPKLTKNSKTMVCWWFIFSKILDAKIFAGVSPRTFCLVAIAINWGLFVGWQVGSLNVWVFCMVTWWTQNTFCIFGNLVYMLVHDYSTSTSIYQHLIFKPSSIRQVVQNIQTNYPILSVLVG